MFAEMFNDMMIQRLLAALPRGKRAARRAEVHPSR